LTKHKHSSETLHNHIPIFSWTFLQTAKQFKLQAQNYNNNKTTLQRICKEYVKLLQLRNCDALQLEAASHRFKFKV